jgi:hypothetical protein
MSVLITEKIPIQNFEIVKNKVEVILFTELNNQNKLQCKGIDIEVFTERQEPYSNGEDVVVNVSLNNIPYSQIDTRNTTGNLSFNIDVYASGFTTLDNDGNKTSRSKLELVTGWIRYILSSTKYNTLGFPKGVIGGTYVDSIQFDDNYGNQEANYIRMARIQFSVKVIENQELWTGIELLGNDTVIKINNGSKGYKLTFNN